jgi:transcriptional regulator with XRE-family HTH domain
MPIVTKVRKVIEKDFPNLGLVIKKARKSANRPLTQICEEINMTTANWYKIENGDTKVLPLETLRTIEKVLGIDLGVKFD